MINLRGIVRIVLAGSAALAVAAGLTACTSGVEPLTTFTPTPTESEPSVEPSPSPTMTEEERLLALIPEDAKGDDLYAAEAMAKFFLELDSGLFRGEDPDLYLFLSKPDCEFCASTVNAARKELNSGLRQSGGGVTVEPNTVETYIHPESGFAYVTFFISEASGAYVDDAGAVVREFPGGRYKFGAELEYDNGLWRVRGGAIAQG